MLEDFKNAFQRHNNAHIQLIIINVVIFLVLAIIRVPAEFAGFKKEFLLFKLQIALPAPFEVFITRPWTIITYAFVHSLEDIWHILMNMLMLYWFGRLFVEYLGSDKLIAVYVLGAIAGGLLFLLAFNTIDLYSSQAYHQMPDGQVYGLPMVGASAAINAIVVAIATLLPDYTFFLLLIGPVRIKYIAIFLVFVSYIGTLGENSGGNIAHLGGALIGFIYTKQLQAGINWGGWVTVTIDWFKGLFKPRPKVKVTYRAPATPPKKQGKNKVSQDEIDAILDKISAGGYESLTKEEKEKLFNASKKNG